PRKRLRFSFITELSRLRSDDLPHHLPGNTEVTAYRLDRLTVNEIRATDLSNRLHDQHSNLGSHENGSQCGPSVTGSRLDADHPEKRGPYSIPKHRPEFIGTVSRDRLAAFWRWNHCWKGDVGRIEIVLA